MYNSALDKVGNTPMINYTMYGFENINLFSKLEYYNPTGSVKDRAASYILSKMLKDKIINKDTLIIESTSGNFGIALSSYCKRLGLKFCAVIDPHITMVNETIINSLCPMVIKVTEPDNNGGYLKTRLKKVREIEAKTPNSFWVNQYENPLNAEAYYNTLGEEICAEVKDIDYIFVGVSSGGTITGLSRKIKDTCPNAKVIAVDIVGSVIFGGAPRKRYIPGMGSSIVPPILKQALIDEVVMVEESEIIEMCNRLLKECLIFAGGSSGTVLRAVEKYFHGKVFDKKPNVVTIFPDRGDRYVTTVYDKRWCDEKIYKILSK